MPGIALSANRNPISDYAWYVCYGSNLLGKRFDYYLRNTESVVYAEKPYMLDGEIYFAKESSKWDNKGVCFLDLNKNDRNSYGWAYLVNKEKIDAISSAEGSSWYPVQELGKDEYGICAYTVTNDKRLKTVEPGTDYLTIIAAGLIQRFNLTQNQMRRYLKWNERIYVSDSMIDKILQTHCE